MAEHEEDDVGPRSFWSGTITFGLVSIPVELFPGSRSQRVSLRMVAPDGTPLVRRYFCPKEEKALEWDEIVRGYEIEKDTYVVVTDDELMKLAPEKTRDIDLRQFVDVAQLDPMHFERAYYLTPGGNSTKAYRLLAATMEQTGRAGIATFVMRGKEYLIAILAENGILRAETMRFADEVRSVEDVELPAAEKPGATRVRAMEKAIAALSESALDESELEDRSAEKLLELVARKERSGKDVVAAPAGEAAPASEGIIDLMEVLKRSLQGTAGGTAKRAARRDAEGAGREKAASPSKTGRKSPKSNGNAAAKSDARAGGKSSPTAGGKSGRKSGGKAAPPTREGAKWSKSHLRAQSKDELYEQAKKLNIEGRSSMTKDELVDALSNA
ncbi:MAG TPA: Ku protein [Longimicrobiales bacterium]|nr:Ku protein [Longimicrobiales bacterium]